jgi:hypothetical protein
MKIRFLVIGGMLLGSFVSAETTPTQITTSDGRTYNHASVLRAEPDGIVISFQPEPAGIGMAKLKYRNLPDSLRSQYSYDADKASAFETQQAQAAAQQRAQFAAADSLRQFRQLAELNRSLAGDFYSSYSIFLDGNGKVTGHGFTGNVVPYTLPYLEGIPSNANHGATPSTGH